MADGMIRVEGARQLRSTLRAAGADLDDLKRAHAAASELVARAARAPVRSGRLQSTIRAGQTRTAAIVRAGYKSVPYAGPIHWGWPARNIAANPFLTEAAQSTEPQWITQYEQDVERILDQVQGA